MDRTLANFYDTQGNMGVLSGGYDGEDLQKQAAAEFLVKLAAEEGVDLASLPDEQVGQLLAEIEGGMGQTKVASNDETEMREKLAEADFLGRAMAHAYVDELASIEKQAKPVKPSQIKNFPTQPTEAEAKAFEEKVMAERAAKKRAAESASSAAKYEGPAAAGTKASGQGRQVGKLEGAAREAGHAVKQYHKKGVEQLRAAISGGGRSAGERLALGARGAARFLPHAAAAGLGIYGASKALGGKKEEKEARSYDEQFEQIAAERANQMLIENGYIDQEKTAEQRLEDAIETRALMMLEEAGYPVQWNE